LSATHLNDTAVHAVPTPHTSDLGTKPNAGPAQALKVDFTPADANYNAATKTVSINVLKGNPVITWATPADITYPTLLSGTQLNATADVTGDLPSRHPPGCQPNPE